MENAESSSCVVWTLETWKKWNLAAARGRKKLKMLFTVFQLIA
jgi:hypothetical protein